MVNLLKILRSLFAEGFTFAVDELVPLENLINYAKSLDKYLIYIVVLNGFLSFGPESYYQIWDAFLRYKLMYK